MWRIRVNAQQYKQLNGLREFVKQQFLPSFTVF